MHNIVHIIKSLQQTTSRNDKEAILEKAYNDGNYQLFGLLWECYNPYRTFGVSHKMVPDYMDESKESNESKESSYIMFKNLLDRLYTRTVTGNAAKKSIEDYSKTVNKDVWDIICKPILTKDIRCGLTENTINKVLKKLSKNDGMAKQLIIPSFSCQLAQDGAEQSFTGCKIIQQKLDGVRLLTFCDIHTKTVTQYTRNGKQNINFPKIIEYFENLLPLLPESCVFDGEIVGKNFQDIMCQINRKYDVNGDDAKLALFDYIPMNDFIDGGSSLPQTTRTTILSTWVGNNDLVFVLPYITIDFDSMDGNTEFLAFNKKVIEDGYEGVMVKDPLAPYKCDRTKYWMKVKPFIEESLIIQSVEEGTGKYEGKMGNLICSGMIDDKMVSVSVGSGFSDEQRHDLWIDRENIIGMVVEIRADVLTKDKNSDNIWSLRFPRFKGFRGSEKGEKI